MGEVLEDVIMGQVVVNKAEEAPTVSGLDQGSGGEGCREGLVDGGHGDAQGHGGLGIQMDEEHRNVGDTGVHEAMDASAGLVEGLEERGAIRLGHRRRGGRHGGRLAALVGSVLLTRPRDSHDDMAPTHPQR